VTGLRLRKPPTRRQLAETLLQTLPIVNGQSHNQDVLKTELDTVRQELDAFRAMTRWQRLKWLLR
jgi:hypothetical protein